MMTFFVTKPRNAPFHQTLGKIQCNAIAGAIRGTSKEKIYEELGLESL